MGRFVLAWLVLAWCKSTPSSTWKLRNTSIYVQHMLINPFSHFLVYFYFRSSIANTLQNSIITCYPINVWKTLIHFIRDPKRKHFGFTCIFIFPHGVNLCVYLVSLFMFSLFSSLPSLVGLVLVINLIFTVAVLCCCHTWWRTVNINREININLLNWLTKITFCDLQREKLFLTRVSFGGIFGMCHAVQAL